MKKIKVINVIAAICAALLFAAIVINLLSAYSSLTKNAFDGLGMISTFFIILTCIFAVYYVIVGCKKTEGAKYYRWFMGLFALCELSFFLHVNDYYMLSTVLIAVSFGALCVLTFGKDLGQIKSTVFAVIPLASSVIINLDDIVHTKSVSAELGTILLLAVTAVVMVCAKYTDKHSRGSK